MPNSDQSEGSRDEDKQIEKLNKLNIERNRVKASLTRFTSFLDSVTPDQIVNLELRLKHLETSLLPEFNSIQDRLEVESPDEIYSPERSNFEDIYYAATSRAVSIIRQHYDNKVFIGNSNSGPNNLNQKPAQITHSPKGLPTIELIKFYGEFEKWSQFRDLFRNLVHEDQSIDKIKKFYYLLSSLKGEALRILESIDITEQNYDLAWNLLNERYENTTLTIKNHIKALFELPTVSKDKYSLRQLIDDFLKRFRSLKLLKEPVEYWSTILIHLLTTKLDFRTLSQWEECIIRRKNTHPELNDLLDFLSDRCKLLEATECSGQYKRVDRTSTSRINESKKQQAYSFQQGKANNNDCAFCKGKHHIYRCDQLSKLPVASRIEEITKLSLCSNCLRSNHSLRNCLSQGCKICSKRHNTLLHPNDIVPKVTIPNNPIPNPESSDLVNQKAGLSVNHSIREEAEILLSTANVLIENREGRWKQCRALLDSGAQSNFITKALAEELNIPFSNTHIPIIGIGDTSRVISQRVSVKIKSHDHTYRTEITCLVLDRITDKLPSHSFSKSVLNLPKDIVLADRDFSLSRDIDLLLGATIFYDILCNQQRNLGNHLPILQSTAFGWVISGPIPLKLTNAVCNFSTSKLENQLQKFWEIEEIEAKQFLTHEEEQCEKIFTETLKRDLDGRFVTTLPIRKNDLRLGNSSEAAIKRLIAMERKFRKNSDFQEKYIAFMEEYEQLGHMTKISTENINCENTGKNLCYLPHHGVINETSSTTSLRVVFDGSAETSTGISLNNILMTGPIIQDDLFSVLIRFRQHEVVFTADVTKMYRQVKISENQRNLQRIVWRKSPTEEISHYQLTTVTYGTSSASFLAIRALQQIAIENQEKFPDPCEIIATDFYVDDLISGASSIENAIKLKNEVNHILSQYGFNLRKWASNYPEVISQESCKGGEKYQVRSGEVNRTLGLEWKPKSDTLTYATREEISSKFKLSKRTVLSSISKIFDPLGLLNPITVRAKILMQRIWSCTEGWDSTLPIEIQNMWLKINQELSQLNSVEIKRHTVIPNATYIELHAFCDASQSAYGTCLYLRSLDRHNSCFTQLLCAKSRVAPLKTISIPKLELCGAVLAVNLVKKVQKSLRVKIDKVHFWTDSMIVLSWLSLSPSNLKIFVANRVSDIQTLSKREQWRHVPTSENPADLISRGTTVCNMKNSCLWWLGPEWLQGSHTSNWPNNETYVESIPEIKAKKVTLTTIVKKDFSIFRKFSNLFRLLRTVAYCYRFFRNCKGKNASMKIDRATNVLSVDEVNHSLTILIRLAQLEMFSQDVEALGMSKPIHKKSRLLPLSPFIGSDNLLRVGGRLGNTSLSFEEKHPIILHPKHPLTRLIILNEHHKNLHAGALLILSTLRDKFWIIHGRRAIRSVLKNCIVCFRIKPKQIIQKMANLPADRVTQYRPFFVSGVDFAGPFLIKDGRLRNRALIKAYLCIFICFTTKAVHLELVGDLSSDSFLNALKRFVSRRGLCKIMYSDNGTNFVGANNKLSSVMKLVPNFVNEPGISNYLLQNSIEWKFIPPRSPHHGGLWEAAVKRAKYHITRVLGNSHLTFEKLCTLFAQVEAAINSSPITPLSEDPSDYSCLTPGHFLIGAPLLSIPEKPLTDLPFNRLSQYEELQKMFQLFWKKWSKDYLQNLQQRSKWLLVNENDIKRDSMVLIIEDNLPPLCWKLGRILEVHPSADGVVRVVTVKTASGVVTRAVQKLCLLPVDDTNVSLEIP